MDKGRAMIDVMNRLGVTHCSLGNHECDAGIQALTTYWSESTLSS